MIGWRKARNVALVSLVVAGAGGVATAALAGAAPAPWAHLRVCNSASVVQSFRVTGTNEVGLSAQTSDYSLAPKDCVTVPSRWRVGQSVTIGHVPVSTAHSNPLGWSDMVAIPSDTPTGSTVTANITLGTTGPEPASYLANPVRLGPGR